MTTDTPLSVSEKVSEDKIDGVLALARISRSLKNGTPMPSQLSWERLSALSQVVRHGPISISKLSELETVTCATMSRTVASLRQGSLVRCNGSATDARAVLVTSTAKGRTALEKGFGYAISHMEQVVSKLPRSVIDSMVDLIKAFGPSGQA